MTVPVGLAHELLEPLGMKRSVFFFSLISILGWIVSIPAWSTEPRFSEIVLNHHFFRGQNFVYTIPFTPKEILFHPSGGVEIKWHASTRSLRFITKKEGVYGVQVLHPLGHWLSLSVSIYPSRLQTIAVTLHKLSMRGHVLKTSVHTNKKGTQIHVRGTIYDPRDWIDFCRLVAHRSSEITSHVHLYPPAFFLLVEKIKSIVAQRFGPRIWIRSEDQNIVISGQVHSQESRNQLLALIRRCFLRVDSKNLRSGIGLEQQVQLALEFVEIKDGKGMTFGVNPNDHRLTWQLNSAISFQAFVSLLVKQGKAKVLSKPTLVARHHVSAHLHIGGEIPYEIKTRQRLNIEWKKYGIALNITPHPLDSHTVHLVFKLSVSFPMSSPNTTSHLPAFSIRSIQSEVVVVLGETAILSGMLQHLKHFNESGIPGLSQIPLLGHLFKLTDSDHTHTQLLVAITPKPYHSSPELVTTHNRQRLLQTEVADGP